MSLFAEYAPGGAARPRVEGLAIRFAEPADLDVVAALATARNGGSLEERRARISRELRHRRRQRLFVAETADGVIGYAWVKRFRAAPDAPPGCAPDGWYLLGVVVDPAWRRRGVGTALTRARLDFIAHRASQAYYAANAGNRPSIDLHVQFGFTELSRDFVLPRVHFAGGKGVLFRAELTSA